jgi:prephenate dehydratase
MRVGYFGPEGTFTHEAVMASAAQVEALELVPLPTIHDTVMAVDRGEVARAVVPIENSLEGSVNATLDALAMETDNVVIVGEVIQSIRHCLITRTALELGQIEAVISHPQATAQCARFLRARLGHARVLGGTSTADAVRMVAEHDGPWAALGTRLAAEQYGCRVLEEGVEDVPENETRFAWLGPIGSPPGVPGSDGLGDGPWKTAIVFWGLGDDGPGWLVGCLTELATRGINLTRIESRPRKVGLGHYLFFLELEGGVGEARVTDALKALRERVEVLRMLGSFPAAGVGAVPFRG